jgi:hypothetical protein
MKTKSYITLRDRTWKGKEWFTSYKSQKFIRQLTEEEAKPLLEAGTIKEVIPVKRGKDIVGSDNGRIFCNECGSRKGFYIKKFPFGKKVIVYTCAECGIREVKDYK